MSTKRILILDDELDMAMTIGEMLDFVDNGDFEHDIVHNVVDALSMVAVQKYDCIISDIHLPGIDGFSFIQKLRELGITTPVIMTSGRSDHGLKDKIQSVGGFDFLPKPFDISKVSDLILASLEKVS